MEKEVEFTCKDGVVEMDMSKYIPEETMESFKNMEVEMEFEALTIPENLEAGQYFIEMIANDGTKTVSTSS